MCPPAEPWYIPAMAIAQHGLETLQLDTKITPAEENCLISPELANARESLGNPRVSLQGGGNGALSLAPEETRGRAGGVWWWDQEKTRC